MIKLLAAIFFAVAFSANADTQPRGADRLRELVVFPEMNLNFSFGITHQENQWVISQNTDLTSAIAEQTAELKSQPDDIKQLLHLAYLLDSNGETNKSRSFYQKAEQLCRDKAAANPQDGLNLTDLGEALWELDKNDEAESCFRKATLVSSNDWKCWVSLGNFLPTKYFFSMFPTNLWGQIILGQMPSQEVLDYWPSAEALEKAQAACDEASRCFDRAMLLAPNEPEVFFQRAGFMCSSNWQNCFFRHYRDYEKISPQKLLMSFFCPETIANLDKAAELKPKDYQYIGLAAYFEYCVAVLEANNFTPDTLPDKTRQSIHNAMARLESLSEDPDKKTAAGALESLGFLNMAFRNMSAATANFRQAVTLDPTRETSWDMWLGSLVGSASPDELTAICESRLKYKDSAHNHLLLAKTLARQKKWDKATEQAEIARQQEPNNIVPPLMLAAIALKQSEQTNYMSIARANLIRASVIIQNMDKSDEKDKRSRELLLDLTILYALDGEPEDARHLMERFLKRRPNDSTAKEILEAVN
jgi:tetratricopeptide (TPR) repeat protein